MFELIRWRGNVIGLSRVFILKCRPAFRPLKGYDFLQQIMVAMCSEAAPKCSYRRVFLPLDWTMRSASLLDHGTIASAPAYLNCCLDVPSCLRYCDVPFVLKLLRQQHKFAGLVALTPTMRVSLRASVLYYSAEHEATANQNEQSG